jgi:phage terminase large subunit-like protein
MDKVKITKIEIIPPKDGKKYGKRGSNYYLIAKLTDEKGEEHGVAITSRLARELPATIERYKENVEKGRVSVQGSMIVTEYGSLLGM